MFLEVIDVKKNYAKTDVLKGISFSVDKGQNLAIVGTSGSGKSTLLYILGALEHAEHGKVVLEGVDISNFSDDELALFRNQFIGFVFQFHFLLPSMNCLDNTLLPAKIGKHNIKEVKARIIKYAKILDVEHCLKKYPFEISGGEQQRINIIRAISLNPKLLLCDEPTGNLDSVNTQKVIKLLQDLAREINSTLIVVTHDGNVSDAFDQKITIEDGQIIS